MKRWIGLFAFLFAMSFVFDVFGDITKNDQAVQGCVWIDNDVGIDITLSYDSQNTEIQINNQISTPLLYICLYQTEITYDCLDINNLNNSETFIKILKQSWIIGSQRDLRDFKSNSYISDL